MRALRTLSTAVLLLAVLAAPAAAYTIYLKDGSRIVATEKYKVEGDRALIKLPSGTVSTIKASEIDVPRTDAANQGNYGTAVVLEGATIKDTPSPPPPPEQNGLSQLIASKSAGPRELPDVKRAEPAKVDAAVTGKTPGGAVDFSTLPHNPLPVELTGDIQKVFYEHGVRELSIWRGTRPDHALVEVTVSSEASTFKAIAVAAKVLESFRQQHRTDLTALELSLVASQGGRAGQFTLTGEQATDLLASKVEISAFYVQNLQF